MVPAAKTEVTESYCEVCGRAVHPLSRTLPVCIDCLRSRDQKATSLAENAHRRAREKFGLPVQPPRERTGIQCRLCLNECRIAESEPGYCGLRRQQQGRLRGVSSEEGNVSWYYDRLPTNCVADWVCPGGTGAGYPVYSHSRGPEYGFKNLAVFYHGCSFDCLFCQNWSHRQRLAERRRISPAELAGAVDEKTSCICYFGGDPTPQLPHSIETSRKALMQKRGEILRICWETNGSMREDLVDEMVSLSLRSGGCIKFDVKAWDENLHIALCGVSNSRTKRNVEAVARRFGERPEPPLLVISTLLIPGYIDETEIKSISRWIVSMNPQIPYALLAFYPQFFFRDLSVTSREFAFRARAVAEEEGLERVKIGNMHLLC